jgi:hypothetical protein
MTTIEIGVRGEETIFFEGDVGWTLTKGDITIYENSDETKEPQIKIIGVVRDGFWTYLRITD